MKLIMLLLLSAVLAGCVTPVKREFPAIPPGLTKTCPDLALIPKTDRFSTVLEVITENYALYRECQIKSQTWLEWYRTQKEIFDSVK